MSCRFLYLFFLAPSLSGCSTVSETLFDSEAPSYESAFDSTGKKYYRRQQIIHESQKSRSSILDLLDITDAIATVVTPSLSLEQQDRESGTIDVNISENTDSGSTSSGLTIGVFAQEQTLNTDISYEFVGDIMSWDVGFSMVASDKTYLGFSTMARIQAPWKVAPYFGAGIYGGDSKHCEYEPLGAELSEEICEKYFLISIVGELGVQFQFNEQVRTRLAIRHFTNTRQEDPLGKTLYGVNFGILF